MSGCCSFGSLGGGHRLPLLRCPQLRHWRPLRPHHCLCLALLGIQHHLLVHSSCHEHPLTPPPPPPLPCSLLMSSLCPLLPCLVLQAAASHTVSLELLLPCLACNANCFAAKGYNTISVTWHEAACGQQCMPQLHFSVTGATAGPCIVYTLQCNSLICPPAGNHCSTSEPGQSAKACGQASQAA